MIILKGIRHKLSLTNAVTSVADPDYFVPDLDPTFENVRIRILASINFRPNFFWNFLAEIFSKKYDREPKS
jgi:hypothetical protein